MRFTEYVKENCFFWVNTLLFVLLVIIGYFVMEQSYKYYLLISGFITTIIFGLLVALIILYSEEYVDEFKRTVESLMKNWVIITNSLGIIIFLASLLILLNWRTYMSFELKYSFYTLAAWSTIYLFLFLKNKNSFIKDYKKNGGKYFLFLTAIITPITIVTYMIIAQFILNDFEYIGLIKLFRKIVEIVNVLFVISMILSLVCAYIYVLYKKIKLFVQQVVIN
ncbi:MAG: hypothetical protein QM490_02435 [Candidatus Gracilibacteria bacterium]